MDLNKFTERSRGFIQAAQTIAMREGHQRLLPEHLLKALMDDDQGLASNLIAKAGGKPARVVEALEAALAKVPKVSGDAGQVYMDSATAKVLDEAEQVARKAGDSFVPVERILMALCMVKSKAKDALDAGAVSAQNLNAAINDIRKGRTADSASAEDTYEALEKYARDLTKAAEEGKIDLEAMAAMIRPEHKLVALAHVSNVLGSVLDVRRASDIAHSAGAKILIDGCQAIPRLKLDMQAFNCDFYAFSAHKLYGPTGIGAIYVRKEILDAMPPWQGGGSMIDRVTFEKTTYAPAPTRFEAGTPAIIEAMGLTAAIDYVERYGIEAIERHEAALVAKAREALSSLNSVRIFGPQDSAGIISFEVEGVHPHDAGTILDEEGVAIRAGHHCAQPLMDYLGVPATARASFGIYSNESDVEALVQGIERVRKIFG